MKDIRVGQIWTEVDPRFARFVRVETVAGGTVGSIGIRTVVARDGRWVDGPKSRLSYANRERFNGKARNYALHLDVPAED